MSTHVGSTSNYLLYTESVLSAGRQLKDMLGEGEDFETLEYAVTRLEEAAGAQDTGTTNYRAFMFSALEQSKVTQKETRERITEDVLATVVTDLQIGDVLVAAGQALGEASGQARLDEALSALEETTPVLTRGLSSPLSAGAKPGRFNFAGAPAKAQAQVVQSPDPKAALATFESLSRQTLEEFVRGLHGVAISVLEAIKKLSPEKYVAAIGEALEGLGGPVKAAVEAIGRLIKKGLEKAQSAIDALVRLIGNDALTKVKDSVKEFWGEATKQKLEEVGDALLAKLIGVDTTRQNITAIIGGGKFAEADVDKASNELTQLAQPFKDNMEMAKKAVTAISKISAVLFFTPIAGQKIALFAASSYFVIMAGVILIAMDYTDSGVILQRVRGVGEIANSLRPAPPPPPLNQA